MKQIIASVFAVGILASGLSACHPKDAGTPQNTDYIMFVNATVGSPSLSLLANAKTINSNGIGFLGYTPYQAFTGNDSKNSFAVYNGSSPYVSDYEGGINYNSAYTFITTGSNSSPTYTLLNDNTEVPVAGFANVRIVRPQVDQKYEDIYLGNDQNNNLIGSETGSKIPTTFDSVAAGTYTLRILNHGDTTQSYFSQSGVTLNEKTNYTLLITGSPDGTGDASLKLTVISNQLP